MAEQQLNLTAYEFEKSIDSDTLLNFVRDNFMLSVWSSLVYVVVIFGGQWIMDRQDRFGLSSALAFWSGMLAVFSVMGTVRMWPELLHVLKFQGVYKSTCYCDYMEHSVTSFWTGLFILSKIIELGDTVFIVLRKQPLIFLHWYHHITVLIYSWYSFAQQTGNGRWFICMNYAVHAVMYSYYALRALKFKVPNQVRIVIRSEEHTSELQSPVPISYAVFCLKKKKKKKHPPHPPPPPPTATSTPMHTSER